MEQISVILDRAWECRFGQKTQACRELLTSLRERLRLGDASPSSSLAASSSEDFDTIASLCLLTASLDRAEGLRERARALIQTVAEAHRERGRAEPFLLAMQRGLTSFVDGDYAAALDRFLVARDRAETPHRRALAIANLVLCLENLGLPLTESLREFRAAVDACGDEKVSLADAAQQLDALEKRQAFRRGDLEAALASPPSSVVTQAVYYRLWLGELPFHVFHRTAQECQREAFLLGSPYFHLKSYRLRTLQGIVHPDDSENFRLSELVDRLYLWTWRWLYDPASLPADKLASQLAVVRPLEKKDRLSIEDAQMLRNVLLWIALFCPARTGPLRRLAHSLAPTSAEDFPLFALEAAMLEYLFALREGESAKAARALEALRAHPLWKNAHLKFADIVEGVQAESETGSSIVMRLRSVCGVARRAVFLTVDLGAFRLIREGHADVVSEALCLALELLRAKPAVDVTELAAICLGLPRYDPEIHSPRVFNLLARLRSIASTRLTFRFRAGRVYAEGAWSDVRFERADEVTLALQTLAALDERRPAETAPTRTWARPAAALKSARGKTLLTREDIEKMTGTSRSTATRLLNRWLADGSLAKVGHAKNTRYRWVERENA